LSSWPYRKIQSLNRISSDLTQRILERRAVHAGAEQLMVMRDEVESFSATLEDLEELIGFTVAWPECILKIRANTYKHLHKNKKQNAQSEQTIEEIAQSEQTIEEKAQSEQEEGKGFMIRSLLTDDVETANNFFDSIFS
jgi:hypothetical protein